MGAVRGAESAALHERRVDVNGEVHRDLRGRVGARAAVRAVQLDRHTHVGLLREAGFQDRPVVAVHVGVENHRAVVSAHQDAGVPAGALSLSASLGVPPPRRMLYTTPER